MLDVLEEDQELEEEANAVLGGSDEKYCTYGQGTVGRQALYACTTCIIADMQPAGICLACSYDCHEGHDLVEMYTKRNFRCDCGNSRFPNLICKFYANKSAVNASNKYNHNFKGLYCTCQRPYPDPEDDIEDEMIQCIVCEDWFHGRHLGIAPPVNFDYQEMICGACMICCDFLWAYSIHPIETKIEKEDNTAPVNIQGQTHSPVKCCSENQATSSGTQEVKRAEVHDDQEKSPRDNQTSDKTQKITLEKGHPQTENKSLASLQNSGQSKDESNHNKARDREDSKTTPANCAVKKNEAVQSSDDTTCICKLEELKKRDVKVENHATFWALGWRTKLCVCDKCKKLYEDKDVTFLLDESDTVHHYEQKGKSKQVEGSQYEQGMRAFSGMNRVQQVEVLHGYNDMKTELKEYLRKFAEQGKVVRQEDIAEFFETMQARKRQRTDDGPQLQHFCR
ncbi:putative E3 ubiquitin-protein ligase UBR7 [Glandiceps talaboti]